MTSFATPIPGTEAPQAPPGISGLMDPGMAQPMGPSPQQIAQAYMEQIRALHEAIDALAQDHPEASKELNDAKLALSNSMGKVAASATSPEGGPQPQTF